MSQLTGTMGQPAMGGAHSLWVGLRPRGLKRMAGTSRMNREIHVRNCGGLEVKFLRSTRQENAWQKTMSGEVQGDERKRTIDEVSK